MNICALILANFMKSEWMRGYQTRIKFLLLYAISWRGEALLFFSYRSSKRRLIVWTNLKNLNHKKETVASRYQSLWLHLGSKGRLKIFDVLSTKYVYGEGLEKSSCSSLSAFSRTTEAIYTDYLIEHGQQLQVTERSITSLLRERQIS